MDIRSLLQANCDRLLNEYQANLNATLELQAILIDDVLPSVATELELDEAQQKWVKEWLEDTHMVFYVMRKQRFTRSFALDVIRKNIEWRIENLWPLESDLYPQNVHCLPANVRDPLGRPILIVRATPFKESSESDRDSSLFLHAVEHLRLCLKALNDASDETLMPFLQYVVLLDVKEFSMQNMSVEFVMRFINELTPKFPGMVAAVFILNSSWTQVGLWSIAKRFLPASAVSRVFFPSANELVSYFTPSSLPKDYGGDLAPLKFLNNYLHPRKVKTVCNNGNCEEPSSVVPRTSPASLSPMSSSNPYFGYPLSISDSGSSSLRHGRKRKRDLARTLLTLLWHRWRGVVSPCLWTMAIALAIRLLWVRRSLHSSSEGVRLLKAWWSSVSLL
ncbi:hypothetical protein E1B28_000272 [Marasmius oreades]|uniref:CRAL-TRIO domain-containing protein n=1 Tax=Marasmius oreades TaxID=181124 RepID=A0A9P7V138_9AGAR|nr:uncharacterized protein E1B28_000272 [Marasmius oreades]KAG7098311.1 hypothetical protein E1B28_000272 [Marasmius oreades]